MNTPDNVWKKLTQAARQTPVNENVEAPFGFASRVVAQWRAGQQPRPSAWELLSVRSLAFATLVMIVCLSLNYEVVQEQFSVDPTAPVDLDSLVIDE